MRTDESKFPSGLEQSREMFQNEMDPIKKVEQSFAYCFDDVLFAENYVDAIILFATDEIANKPKMTKCADIVSPIIEELLLVACQADGPQYREPSVEFLQTEEVFPSSSHNVFSGWPKVSDFNIKLGLEKLEEYIQSWQKSEELMSCVEFIGFESEESSNYFVYEVEFSIPNAMYPIPQVTASVYFSLEVSKIIPPPYDGPVQVTYVFESSNVIHVPGRIDFQETWIKDLMRCKLKLFRTLTF